jgi:hypothetical protein
MALMVLAKMAPTNPEIEVLLRFVSFIWDHVRPEVVEECVAFMERDEVEGELSSEALETLRLIEEFRKVDATTKKPIVDLFEGRRRDR